MITEKEKEEEFIYIQEIYIYFPSKWIIAHEIQKELINVIEKYFENIKNITHISRIQYGVRPIKEKKEK